MMNEIYQRGPITCSMAANDDFTYNFGGVGIYHENNFTEDDLDHDIEVWSEDGAGVRLGCGTRMGRRAIGMLRVLPSRTHHSRGWTRTELYCKLSCHDVTSQTTTVCLSEL